MDTTDWPILLTGAGCGLGRRPALSNWWETLTVNPACTLPTTQKLQALVADGGADRVAVGWAFLINPDLVRRLQESAELNRADQPMFYGWSDVEHIGSPTSAEAA